METCQMRNVYWIFSGVIDEFGDWSGDVDFFAQTWDIINRCAEHLDNIYSFTNRILLEGMILSFYLI